MGMNMQSGRGGRRRRGSAPMAEINVTPLVDVMLVLLIIFMVTAPLLMAGVKVDLPDSRAEGLEQSQEPVSVTLDAEGRIYIGEEEVDMASLPPRFVDLAAIQPEAPQIYLRADRSLPYGKVMAVMGELNHAGLNKVSMVTTGVTDSGTADAGASDGAEAAAVETGDGSQN